MANSLYLEWHSDLSGRFVIESADYRLEISEPVWRFTPEELAERARAAEESSNAFAIEIHADGTEEEWDEFRCEELLRESDARGDKYRRLLEKYVDHPDRERIIAHEMGWTWLEHALDEQDSGEPDEPGEITPEEMELPAPDPSREGIDWVRDKRGHIVHPIGKRATDMLHTLFDELRAAGNPEERHEGHHRKQQTPARVPHGENLACHSVVGGVCELSREDDRVFPLAANHHVVLQEPRATESIEDVRTRLRAPVVKGVPRLNL